jgi:L-lactate dehydrogenase complex protein LldG
MNSQARDEILSKLKSARKIVPTARPAAPELSERALNSGQMLERFTAELAAQTGTTYTAKGAQDAQRILSEIAAAEGLKKVIVAGIDTQSIDIKAWGRAGAVNVLTHEELKDRETLREEAFTADAGITFADFAVAETGTLGIIFDKDQPRLASIAPPVHIAIVPVEKLYPVYEDVITKVFADKNKIPGHFAFITGPSATADIQAINFKGMHGPVKVMVIFIVNSES